MGSRWRRFWRIFFLLEKTERKQFTRRYLQRHPELKYFEKHPLMWRQRFSVWMLSWVVPVVLWAFLMYVTWAASVVLLVFLAEQLQGKVPVMGIGFGRLVFWGVVIQGVLAWLSMLLFVSKIPPSIELRYYRRHFLHRGIPICIRCGYEPGSWTNRCPECGRPIERPADPSVGEES